MYQLNENVWLIEYIHGYYRFSGEDAGLDPETVARIYGQAEDGVYALARGTLDEQSSYLLIRDGDIYRLQLLYDMMESEQE